MTTTTISTTSVRTSPVRTTTADCVPAVRSAPALDTRTPDATPCTSDGATLGDPEPITIGLDSPTRALGVAGWTRLDPLLVAALALEGPVLLIGAHGTAKTLVAERIARSIGTGFRHYNASLLNYDDLVGIPIPDESGGLRFVGTEGAVWGADFVFFDEINRCRPDLQNKMFPIVHERRIGGVDLPDLVHRWAAMNPPQPGGDVGGYVGTEPLDEALADRFWFVVRTPTWGDLDGDERAALLDDDVAAVTSTDVIAATADVAADRPGWLHALVARARDLEVDVDAAIGRDTTRYVIALLDALAGGGVTLSPRRARILRRTLVATVAAGRALGREVELADAFELVIMNGLPHWADVEVPDVARVVAAHVHAFDLAFGDHDGSRVKLLTEPDGVKRIRLALDLGLAEDVVATAATAALSSRPTDAERHVLAAVLRFGLKDHRLTPGAWSAIHEGAARIVEAGSRTDRVFLGPTLDRWTAAVAWLERVPRAPLERAVVLGLGPELLRDIDLGPLVDRLHDWAGLFGVSLEDVR